MGGGTYVCGIYKNKGRVVLCVGCRFAGEKAGSKLDSESASLDERKQLAVPVVAETVLQIQEIKIDGRAG